MLKSWGEIVCERSTFKVFFSLLMLKFQFRYYWVLSLTVGSGFSKLIFYLENGAIVNGAATIN